MVHGSLFVYRHNQFQIDIENVKLTHKGLWCTESTLHRLTFELCRGQDLHAMQTSCFEINGSPDIALSVTKNVLRRLRDINVYIHDISTQTQ